MKCSVVPILLYLTIGQYLNSLDKHNDKSRLKLRIPSYKFKIKIITKRYDRMYHTSLNVKKIRASDDVNKFHCMSDLH